MTAVKHGSNVFIALLVQCFLANLDMIHNWYEIILTTNMFYETMSLLFNYRMADSIGSRPGTSDDYHDPLCKPCEESRGRNFKIDCFCQNCNVILSTEG